mgnify:FL=1|jgi:hypothetical protein
MKDTLLNIFFAYSREDSDLRERLDKHLSGLKRRNYINTWFDGQIEAGTEWEKEIDFALSKADIILLLISADFIASDYCFDVEMKKAISRHEKGDAVIIPIILHPCDWSDLPFSKIQGLPQNGKAITSENWKSPEFALSEIAKSIKETVESLRQTKNKHLRAINEVLNEKDYELRITLEQVEELKLEEEILQESIEKHNKENKRVQKEITGIKSELNELNLLKEEKQNNFQKLNGTEQTKLNKLRTEIINSKKTITKAKKDIESLTKKKSNLEKEINRITK